VQDDKQRFERLVRPHFDALYRAAVRLTRDPADAEDLLQDVFLKAFSKLDELDTVDRPLGWLMRVQYRRFIDLRRSALTRSLFGEPVQVEDVACSEPGVDELAAARDKANALDRAWAELTRDQRALLAMHAEGFCLDELAEITGCTKNALSVRLHRARTRLAKLLDAATLSGNSTVGARI
jgi:RNA polymerase sigma factor (sigma-70 family)